MFIGCGAVVTADQFPGGLSSIGVAAAFGLVVMAMVYATGHLSGAHINPAVTLAFVATRHFPSRDACAYVGAQLIGAAAAGFALLAVWPAKPAALGATSPAIGTGGAILYELLLTAFLMFVIMAVATDTRAVGPAAAIAIGAAVAMAALTGGPISGASMNPARSFGPAIASGQWQDFWIYLVAPTAGALLGAGAYQLVRGRTPINERN